MSAADSLAAPEDKQTRAVEPTDRQSLLRAIGQKLLQSREASGQSIDDAVRRLKLQKRHLQALENGNWEHLPDDVYVLGFLRQYAQYLHVDLCDEIHRLKHDSYALTKPLTFPDPPVAPSRRWAWLTGGAFILLFILFNIATENTDDTAMVKSPPIAAVNDLPTVDIADAPISDDSASASDSTPATMSVPTAIPTETSTVSKAVKPVPPAIDATAPAATHANSTQTGENTPTITPKSGTTPPASGTPVQQVVRHAFRFDAVGSPVWLQISMPDRSGTKKGRLLKEVLLQPGFHTTIHTRTASLWITCGNAPALRIVVDGTVFAAKGSLGAGKKVLRDYRFDIGHN